MRNLSVNKTLVLIAVLLLAFLLFMILGGHFLKYPNRDSDKEQLPEQFDLKAKKVEKTGWQKYYYKEYGVTIYLPKDYELVKQDKGRFNYSTKVWQKNGSESKIYFGDFIVFSTSGSLCTFGCEEVGNVHVKVKGKNYKDKILKKFDESKKGEYDDDQFEAYVFQMEFPIELKNRYIDASSGNLFVTGVFENEKDGQELTDIVGTVEVGE